MVLSLYYLYNIVHRAKGLRVLLQEGNKFTENVPNKAVSIEA